MTIHSMFKKGQKVFVILRDGSNFVDRFVEKKNGTIIFEERGRVPIKDIRTSTIYKLRGNPQADPLDESY